MSCKPTGPPSLQRPISSQNFKVRLVTSYLCCVKGHSSVSDKVRTELSVWFLESPPCPEHSTRLMLLPIRLWPTASGGPGRANPWTLMDACQEARAGHCSHRLAELFLLMSSCPPTESLESLAHCSPTCDDADGRHSDMATRYAWSFLNLDRIRFNSV